MPIKIPEALPAIDVLRAEGVMVMSSETALRQDIRPLQIGLVNLMPNKERTETQFARLLRRLRPLYDAIAAEWGVTVEAADLAAVDSTEAFDALIARALEAAPR